MANLDVTAATGILKEMYLGQVVQNLTYKNNPAFAMLPKMTEFGGENYPIPIQSGVSQGRSSNFSNAQTNQSPVQLQKFLLTRVNDYSLATITNEAILCGATDKMSFVRTAKTAVDGAIQAIKLSMASSVFRSGTGSIGKIATSGITSGVITLTNKADARQFERNMVLQANATDGGGSPRAALGYVIAVDSSAGTVTVATSGLGGTAASPSLWQDADFLLVQGDNNAKMSGFAAWAPASAPSSTPFFGVDRTPSVRLGGLRYDGSSQSIEEAAIDAASLAAAEGATPDTMFMNFASYGALVKSLGSKVEYMDLKVGEIGFRGVRINGAAGEIAVVPDRSCQSLQGWMLQLDTWELCSLGEAPQILTYGPQSEWLRVYNADAHELRVGCYHNLGCNAPGWNVNVTLGA